MDNQAIIEQLISLSDLSAAHQFFLLNFDMLLNYSVSIVILGLGLWMFFKNTFSTLVLSLSVLVMGVFLIASMEAYNSSLNQRQIDFCAPLTTHPSKALSTNIIHNLRLI